MWHKKQQTLGLPGEVRHPERSEGIHVESKMLLAQSGNSDTHFLADSSRKRKSEALDQQGIISESVLKYNLFGESNLQHKGGSLCGMNVQSSASVFSPSSLEQITSRHQSEKCQFHGQNDLAVTEHKAFSFSNACNSSTEMAAVSHGLQDLMGILGHRDHAITNYSPGDSYNPSSGSLKPSVTMQQSLVKHVGYSVDGKSSSYKSSSSGICSDLEQRQHSSNTPGSGDLTNLRASFSGTSRCRGSEQTENCRLFLNEVQPSSAAKSYNVGEKVEGHGDGMVKITRKTEGSDFVNLKNLLAEGTSAKNDESLDNTVTRPCHTNDLFYGSIEFDEKGKNLAGKVAQLFAEKLWDGSLQLNSSVTVTTVAFFKSGEKAPDVNWSESVEVKGKVRLEAFEKYIKDLPRSRNRGLMVVSLHWKEGSSASGLAGMKEVAKGYKEKERVGFAHLSQGADIYVCPRSNAIITILAKYGFFKGMAAVEDNQDSMIGCVVWRRNQMPSNSVVKNSDGKNSSLAEKPRNSPDSSTQPTESTSQVAEKKLSLPQPAEDPPALVTGRTTLCSVGDNDTKDKITKSAEVQLQVGSSQTRADSLPKALPPSKSSSTSGVLQSSSHPNSRILEVEYSLVRISESEKPNKGSELQKPVQHLPPGAIKQPLHPLDDDDLPEFDFGTACGASQTPTGKSSNVMALERRFPPEGYRKMDASVPLVMPNLNQKSSENIKFPRLQTDARMPPPKKACHRDFQTPVQLILGERRIVQSRAIPGNATRINSSKNLLDSDSDDDDMPEWCPPTLQAHRQTIATTTQPLNTAFPSKVLNSSSENAPSSSLLRPFPSQFHPPTFHGPKATTLNPAQHLQRGPDTLRVFNSSPDIRPYSNPPVKLPIHPVDRRGWKS